MFDVCTEFVPVQNKNDLMYLIFPAAGELNAILMNIITRIDETGSSLSPYMHIHIHIHIILMCIFMFPSTLISRYPDSDP